MTDPRITAARQRVRRHAEYPGVLGNGSGNTHAGNSKYWVRFPAGTNADGQTIYSEPRAIRYAGEGSVIAREGTEVLVRIDPWDDVETISRIVPDYTSRVAIDSKVLNSGDPLTKWVDVRNLIRLVTRPVGSGQAQSTQVTTRENPFHSDAYLDISTFAGTLPDDQLDLFTLVPAADEHRLVCIFFDFVANAPVAYASTAQALSTAFDLTDYEECFAQLPHNEHIPLVAVELADAQVFVSSKDVVEDLRTWLPTPTVYGFPNPIASGKQVYIRSTHQQIVFDMTTAGELTIEGEVTIL